MSFLGRFKKEKEINGIIKYLGLEDFWRSCTEKEQADLIRYYQGGLYTEGSKSPIEGNITSSSNTPLKYLGAMIGWATKEKNYELAQKVINAGKQIPIRKQDLLDAHFFYQDAAECYYKQRKINPEAINLSMGFCQKDINILPQYAPLFKAEYGSIPRLETVQRLVIIYEGMGKIEEAIKTCEMAIQYGLSDNTKGGYTARLEKLKKAMK